MFALTDADLRRRIVGCGDGPASFNAELTAQLGRVVSIDPLYAAPARAIERRVAETFEVVIGEVRRNRDDFVWTHVPSIEELGRRRLGAMRRFLSDYGAGAQAGRYVAASLPAFVDGSFDLALSSHFLFLYSEQLDLAFHLDSLREMLRVAGEVRVFPLLQIGGAPSPHVAATAAALRSDGVDASVEPPSIRCTPLGGFDSLHERLEEGAVP